MKNKNVLWVDDEIELLKSHVLFLGQKGYNVFTATNGVDALQIAKSHQVDIIFLDEMMPGLGGLETLQLIKDYNPNIPVVMVTKSEEERLMNDAIGSKIDDYLIKPVNPSQVLLVCKKFLESREISYQQVTRDYGQDLSELSLRLSDELSYQDWIDIYTKLVSWDLELDEHPEVNLRRELSEQKRECNREFGKFFEKNYKDWIEKQGEGISEVPLLTPGVPERYLLPDLQDASGPVFYVIIDCLRLDQWFVMEKFLNDYFLIKKDYYYSILPTATPYSRNALFAGLYPSQIEKYYPELWQNTKEDDEKSQNKYERELLDQLLRRKKISLRNELKYIKIIDPDLGRTFENRVGTYKDTHLFAIVINFLDMIAHGRSDSELLKEIAPDEAAYRSLTSSWFQHSSFLGTLKAISEIKNSKIVITTDHGSIRCLRGAKVIGDRDASTNLRFKFGRNLKADQKNAFMMKNPSEYMLPERGINASYIIAKEDYYFVYPTDYHKYLNYYRDTFQHGGISMEEVILPVITMQSRH